MKRKNVLNKPSKNIILPFAALVLIGIFYGCATLDTRDNKLYEVNQDKNQNEIKRIDGQVITKGKNPFYKVNFFEGNNNIPITISPNKRYIFYLRTCNSVEEDRKIISGEISSKFDFTVYDVQNKSTTLLKSNIPLITLCKWNKQGNIVAFSGGERLYIYNLEKGTFMFEDEVKADYVTYFGWSPDGKRLYTEHTELVNNTIYYMDSEEKIESYNCNDNKYYKGTLDNEYYYATTNEITKPAFQRVTTLIVDKKGNKIKKLYNGKFRDAYGISTLLIGENDFGLYYIKNINNSYEPLLINKEYIYDAKFIYDGNFAYTIKNNENDENNFTMVVVDNTGKELGKFLVSGGAFLVSPDGKWAQVSGENRELINFEKNELQFSTNMIDKEKEQVFKTIRGAGDIIAKYMCTGKYNIDETKKYFANNEKLNQCALFDMENIYKDKNDIIPTVPSNEYDLRLKAEDYKTSNNSMAYVKLLGVLKNSGGSNNNINLELELTKNSKENKWYITGLSNFTYEDEYNKVKDICNEYISKGKEGKIFNGLFKNKDLSLFQIQFWDIRKPGLSLSIEESNYCKVYIKSKEKTKETVYKMILHRDSKGEWELSELKSGRLSYLY